MSFHSTHSSLSPSTTLVNSARSSRSRSQPTRPPTPHSRLHQPRPTNPRPLAERLQNPLEDRDLAQRLINISLTENTFSILTDIIEHEPILNDIVLHIRNLGRARGTIHDLFDSIPALQTPLARADADLHQSQIALATASIAHGMHALAETLIDYPPSPSPTPPPRVVTPPPRYDTLPPRRLRRSTRRIDGSRCFHCHRTGHWRVDCPDYRCPLCDTFAPGHIQRDCWRVQQTIDDAVQDAMDDHAANYDDWFEEGDPEA